MPNVALRKVLLKKEYEQWRENKVTRLINAMSEEDIMSLLDGAVYSPEILREKVSQSPLLQDFHTWLETFRKRTTGKR